MFGAQQNIKKVGADATVTASIPFLASGDASLRAGPLADSR